MDKAKALELAAALRQAGVRCNTYWRYDDLYGVKIKFGWIDCWNIATLEPRQTATQIVRKAVIHQYRYEAMVTA